MNMNVVELASRLRSQAATQLILCKFPRPSDGTAWVWVFGESAGGQLKQLWSGVLEGAEGDTLADELGREKSLWLGGIDILIVGESKAIFLRGVRRDAATEPHQRDFGHPREDFFRDAQKLVPKFAPRRHHARI